MAVELPNGEQTLGLSQYGRCFVSETHVLPYDEEHIIPKFAAGKHPKLFPRGLLLSDENKARVCKCCHRGIDNGATGKIATFRNYGPAGLLEFIAIKYPLPDDPEFRDIFHLQRRVLFMRIRETVRTLQGVSPSRVLSPLHEQVLQTVNMHIGWWDDGKSYLPKLEDRLVVLRRQVC